MDVAQRFVNPPPRGARSCRARVSPGFTVHKYARVRCGAAALSLHTGSDGRDTSKAPSRVLTARGAALPSDPRSVPVCRRARGILLSALPLTSLTSRDQGPAHSDSLGVLHDTSTPRLCSHHCATLSPEGTDNRRHTLVARDTLHCTRHAFEQI